MKAIGFKTSLPVENEASFIEFEIPTPRPAARQLLVKVFASSVNPVDYKVRQGSAKDKVLPEPKIIGWDAVGCVEETGPEVSLFKKGDWVYYAGDISKAGSNSEYQLIDERIVGSKPEKLSIAEAAAMPLTTLTAWEMLYDRLRIGAKDQGKSILIIGGAGGVGSIAIQIAKYAGLKVIATASRSESKAWVSQLGADLVVNHRDLVKEVRDAGIQQLDYILDFVDLNQYWDAIAELIKPQGSVGSISDPANPVNLRQLKGKSVSFHWELMFTRAMFEADDMIRQHEILNEAAALYDKGILKTTLTQTLEGFSADNFKAAHKQLESGSTIGKLVITY